MEARVPEYKLGLAIKLGFYAVVGYIGLIVFAFVLTGLGYLIGAAGTVFASAFTANALSIRTFERLPIMAVGLGWRRCSGRNLVIGFALGVVAATLVTFVPMLLGMAYLEPDPEFPASVGAFFLVTMVLLFGAIGEELLFRGYGFQILVRLVGAAGSLICTALLFGYVHLQNMNATPLGIANTAGFGVVLGYAFLRTGELWLPIGIHFGWNWLLPLAGVRVSGFKTGVTGYALKWHVPELWSGGAYGPEASVLTCGVVAALMIVLWRMPLERTEAALLSAPVPPSEEIREA
jgi:uncharacterized protein